MTRHLITFSGSDYDATTQRIVDSIAFSGADEHWVFDDVWLTQQEFFHLPGNRWLWEHPYPRCFGFCAWKPFLLLYMFDRMKPGDSVVYTDADAPPVASLAPIFEIAERDGAWLSASQGHKQEKWCKRDAYLTMGHPGPLEEQAGCARFLALRKGAWREQQLLIEWLTYSCNRFANSKDPSQLAHLSAIRDEFDGGEPYIFEQHRDEQAILTNLAHKNQIKLHREADQTGEDPSCFHVDRELYGQLFEQVHSTRGSNGLGSRFRRVPT